MKEKINQKGFIQIPLLIAIIVSIIVVSGIGYGVVEYNKTSNLVKESQQLAKEEKYNEAIGKLEIAQNKLLGKIILKQKISTELESNKKLLEDKSEYAQGREEFNKENWERAKELFSKVSEISPYYQEAKNKIEEAEKKITDEQITKAVGEATGEIKRKAEEETRRLEGEIRKTAEEAKKLDSKPQIERENQTREQTTISSTDIEPYLTGIGRIDCKKDYNVIGYSNMSIGSASLWNFDGIGYSVLTNWHVISDIPVKTGYCVLNVADAGDIKADKNRTAGGFFWLDLEKVSKWNTKTDVAVIKITYDFVYGDPPTGLNYSIASLPLCAKRMPLNSPVVIIGFPASTFKYTEEGIYAFRTITNGVVSAHDESVMTKDNLPTPNYFISAKIDSGNSGGMAFSKDSNGLCLLGVPTWLSLGVYETQGIVQNIHNVMYTK